MTTEQKIRYEAFKAAKALAFQVPVGAYKRAVVKGQITNYCGIKGINGRTFVIGDSESDIQNPDVLIFGKPAREVFEVAMMRN